jgi:hypothetical protein
MWQVLLFPYVLILLELNKGLLLTTLIKSMEVKSLRRYAASQEISRLMEPELSLPCSQESATGPYPGLDQSTTPPTLSPQD